MGDPSSVLDDGNTPDSLGKGEGGCQGAIGTRPEIGVSLKSIIVCLSYLFEYKICVSDESS